MKIWIDADACPNAIKNIIYRVANRLQISVTLVANKDLSFPVSKYIKSVRVSSGFDEADKYILKALNPGDLIITADIPLAAGVVEKDAYALNPRGELYTKENVKQKLTMRNFMEEIRSTGQIISGPAPISQRDKQDFANSLDKFLLKNRT